MKIRYFLRAFYILYLILVWGIVFCLSLELGFRVLLASANYLYRPLFERQNRKVYGMAPVWEGRRGFSKVISGEATWNFPHKEGQKSTEIRGIDCKEEYLLTLDGVVKAEFDLKGNLLTIKGDPILKNYLENLFHGRVVGYFSPEWNEVVDTIKHAQDFPELKELKLEYLFSYVYRIKLEKHLNKILLTAKELRDNYPFSLSNRNTHENPNTPWLVFGFAYKPNWRAEGSISQYNNYGFRDDDVVIPKPEGVVRIVCVGGSTTEEGNSNDATYPNIMERKLRQHFNSDKIDVINAGICGIRSFGEVRRVWDYLALQPDLLVYYNAINDICYHYIPEWLTLPNPYRKWLKASTLLNYIFNEKNLPSDEYIAKYFQETILTHLGAINCACKSKGVEMAICSFAYPTLKWYEFIDRLYCDFNLRNVWTYKKDIPLTYKTYMRIINIYNQELKKFCEREGIFYIPVAEEFKAGMDHFFDVCHMTPLGLDIKTDIIGSYVARWLYTKGFGK